MARTMGKDGLIADEVGYWASQKHRYLTRYISISRAARKKYLPPHGSGGSTFIDLFCGTGCCQVRDTGQFIDGSAVAAWKCSLEGGAPFTQVFISDKEPDVLAACESRLKALNAPVTAFCGTAVEAAKHFGCSQTPHGLNFAFLDPYNLDLDFSIISALSKIKRLDMMIHLNQMDMQRNLLNLFDADKETRLDRLAPGWKSAITQGPREEMERQVYEYWRKSVEALGTWTSQQKLITGSKGQPLYWLLLAAKHDLAHQFWSESLSDGQEALF